MNPFTATFRIVEAASNGFVKVAELFEETVDLAHNEVQSLSKYQQDRLDDQDYEREQKKAERLAKRKPLDDE